MSSTPFFGIRLLRKPLKNSCGCHQAECPECIIYAHNSATEMKKRQISSEGTTHWASNPDCDCLSCREIHRQSVAKIKKLESADQLDLHHLKKGDFQQYQDIGNEVKGFSSNGVKYLFYVLFRLGVLPVLLLIDLVIWSAHATFLITFIIISKIWTNF